MLKTVKATSTTEQHTVVFFFLVVRHGRLMHHLRRVNLVLVCRRRHYDLRLLPKHLDHRDVAELVSNGQR